MPHPGIAFTELLPPGESLHQITVPSGTAVTGRLTLNGQPRGGQPVAVVQVNRGRSDRIFIKAVVATTEEDGRFRFTALPANEPYAIFTPVGSGLAGPVLATTLFNAKEDRATHDLGELQLRPGLIMAGHLQMMEDAKTIAVAARLPTARAQGVRSTITCPQTL